MFNIKYAEISDKTFWFTLDRHMSEREFDLKSRDRRAYIIRDGDVPVGILRYNLFWDNTPFLTLIELAEPFRRKGFGSRAMLHWEDEMRALGYKLVMTSTQSDEDAQHFYRKLGYIDTGGFVFAVPQFAQPLEIIFIKPL